eukprot:tig00000829_g4675.t1
MAQRDELNAAQDGGPKILAFLPDAVNEQLKNILKFEVVEKDENDQPAFKSVSLYRAVTAEFVASALFVFLACGAAVASNSVVSEADLTAASRVAGGDARLLVISLSFGMCITVLVFAIGHLSGGHINSAVTISFMFTKKVTLQRGAAYILAQLTGSVVGAGVLKGILPKSLQGTLGVTTVASDMNLGAAIVLEAILTSVLLFTVFSAIDSSRVGEMHHALAPLAIGMAVFVCHLIGVPFTGSSINPSRSFGPAVVTGIWEDHWVYWVGPCLGACITALLYQIWFKKAEEPAKPKLVENRAPAAVAREAAGSSQAFSYQRHEELQDATI